MEIPVPATIRIGHHPLLYIRLHLQSLVQDQKTSRTNQGSIFSEAFQIGLFRPIDIQVVGIGGCNHRRVWRQPMKRTVELVGFNDHVVALRRKNVIRTVILGDATQKGIAVHVALVQDMGRHGRCGGFPVRPGHTKSFMGTRQRAQHLRTFLYLESVRLEIGQLGMLAGDGRCINHQASVLVPTSGRNLFHILFIVNPGTLFLQLPREFGRRAVVTSHTKPFLQEITGYGTHADSPYSYEIHSFYRVHFHLLLLPLNKPLPLGRGKQACLRARLIAVFPICHGEFTNLFRNAVGRVRKGHGFDIPAQCRQFVRIPDDIQGQSD